MLYYKTVIHVCVGGQRCRMSEMPDASSALRVACNLEEAGEKGAERLQVVSAYASHMLTTRGPRSARPAWAASWGNRTRRADGAGRPRCEEGLEQPSAQTPLNHESRNPTLLLMHA